MENIILFRPLLTFKTPNIFKTKFGIPKSTGFENKNLLLIKLILISKKQKNKKKMRKGDKTQVQPLSRWVGKLVFFFVFDQTKNKLNGWGQTRTGQTDEDALVRILPHYHKFIRFKVV